MPLGLTPAQRDALKPNFPHNPAAALQCYADLQRSVAESFVDPDCVRLLFDNDDDEFAAISAWHLEFFNNPRSVDTRIYFWPARTADAVREQAAQYPLALERFELPTRRHLLFFFQRPTVWIDDPRVAVPVSAVSCYYDGKVAWVWPWSWLHGRCQPWPPSWDRSPSNIHNQYQSTLRWLCAAESFAAQRLIGTEVATVNRKIRHRVQGHVPDVHVVHLRTVDSCRTRHPPLYHIDFDFRFWVRGHQRHLADRDEPIWIPAYLKGPDDRPIKERPTLYAVTR